MDDEKAESCREHVMRSTIDDTAHLKVSISAHQNDAPIVNSASLPSVKLSALHQSKVNEMVEALGQVPKPSAEVDRTARSGVQSC